MKKLLVFALILSAGSVLGQDLYELVVKGKKQGVKSTTTQEWLIPMGKHQIIEPSENLFLKIDPAEELIQGFYKDDYFEKTTEPEKAHFFGEFYPIANELKFDDIIVNTEDHSINKMRYFGYENGETGPGACFISGHLIVATVGNSLGLYNLEISKGKEGVIERFEGVEFAVVDNHLLIGKVVRKEKEHPDDRSYQLNEVEDYTFAGGEMKKVGSAKKEEEKFNNYMSHLAGYTDNPLETGNAIDYEKFMGTNFESDSASKYDLIVTSGAGVLFANENQKNFLYYKGHWLNVGKRTFERGNYEYSQNSFFSIESHEQLEVINNNASAPYVHAMNELGEFMYSADGNAIYQDVEDIQESGVWNWETSSWMIPAEYAEINVLNDLIVCKKYVYHVDPEDEYGLIADDIIEIYNLKGEKKKSLEQPSDLEMLEAIYADAKVRKIEGTYNIYEIEKGGKTALIEFSKEIQFTYSIATFEEGVIGGTYNPSISTYVSQKDGKIYMNSYDVELGTTIREVREDFVAYQYVDTDGYGFSTAYVDEFTAEQSSQRFLSGVRKLDDQHILIYNNTYPEIFEKYDDYGEPQTNYDAYGNPSYAFYYDIQGSSNSGLWNVAQKKWDIKPMYESIKPTAAGYTAMRRVDKVDGKIVSENDARFIESAKFYPISDSFAIDLYEPSFSLKEKNFNVESLFADSKNFKYFMTSGGFENCIHQPTSLYPKGHFNRTNTNYWFKNKEGYAILEKNPLTYEVNILLQGMKWVAETDKYCYGLNQEGFWVGAKSSFGLSDKIVVMVPTQFEVFETEKGVYVVSKEKEQLISLGQEATLESNETQNWDKENQNILALMSFSENEIYSHVAESQELYFMNPDEYPYGGATDVRYENDFVWTRDGDQWGYMIKANTIEKTPFGFFVSKAFVKDTYGLPDYFYDENHALKEEFGGRAYFADKNYVEINDLSVTSYYSSKPLEGSDDLHLVFYGDEARPELSAIISEDGKIAVEACSHELKGDVLEYSPCAIDGLGFPLFDENGNQVIKTVKLK